MLTKDLARYRIHKGKIEPLLIDPHQQDLLALAEGLLDIFRSAPGHIRQDLLDQSGALIEAAPTNMIFARGLEKLLMDRTRFQAPEDDSAERFRHTVFTTAFQLIKNNQNPEIESYGRRLADLLETTPEAVSRNLYRDLPANHPAAAFKDITAPQLLDRYNCALVQWLLLHSERLRIILVDADAGALRQFFKYLRFHQLMARVERPSPNLFRIEVDGPFSLFYQNKKYGTQLARFFPALLHQQCWSLSAAIQLKKNRSFELELDHDSGLRPYSHHFLAFVPKEIELLGKAMATKLPQWTLEAGSQFIPFSGGGLCFPDYLLRHESGREVAVELFHAWHAAPLRERLGQLKSWRKTPLILGVARRLTKDPLTADALDGSAYFERAGFLFRDIPTVNMIAPILDRLRES